MISIDLSRLIKIDQRLRRAKLCLIILSIISLLPFIIILLRLIGSWRPLAIIIVILPLLWAFRERRLRRKT